MRGWESVVRTPIVGCLIVSLVIGGTAQEPTAPPPEPESRARMAAAKV